MGVVLNCRRKYLGAVFLGYRTFFMACVLVLWDCSGGFALFADCSTFSVCKSGYLHGGIT